jgi:hypothetical protein
MSNLPFAIWNLRILGNGFGRVNGIFKSTFLFCVQPLHLSNLLWKVCTLRWWSKVTYSPDNWKSVSTSSVKSKWWKQASRWRTSRLLLLLIAFGNYQVAPYHFLLCWHLTLVFTLGLHFRFLSESVTWEFAILDWTGCCVLKHWYRPRLKLAGSKFYAFIGQGIYNESLIWRSLVSLRSLVLCPKLFREVRLNLWLVGVY